MKMTALHKLKRLIPRTAYHMYVDISHCKLKCLMCPRGGISNLKNLDKGLMGFDLFKKIVDKFATERIWIDGISMGNWGDPLLNPDLPKMISYAKSHPTAMKPKTAVSVNTTLNVLPNSLELLRSGIDEIVITISGMTQEVYSRNHKGGNIEAVLKNIKELVRIRKTETLQNIKLRLVFHDYIYNKKDAGLAKKFCDENGLRFTSNRMYICSVEDALCFSENKESLSEHYGDFIDIDKEIALMKTMDYSEIKKCRLRKNRITVHFDGQLYTCCGVYEKKHFMGSIFDFNIKDIPNIDAEVCRKCAEVPISFRP